MPKKKKPTDAEFAAFWAAYPRRVAIGDARKAWLAATKKTAVEEIMDGLRRYEFSPEPKFQPYPATWLRGERWVIDPGSNFHPLLKAVGLTPEDIERMGWERHEAETKSAALALLAEKAKSGG